MFLKNKNIISKIRRSKVTDYAALNGHSCIDTTYVLTDSQMNENPCSNQEIDVLFDHGFELEIL